MRARSCRRIGMGILIFLALGFRPSTRTQAQKTPAKPAHAAPLSRPAQALPAPHKLQKLYSVHFPVNAKYMFSVTGESCDANGNLYLIFGVLHPIPGVPIGTPDLATLPVTRLGLNSQDMTKFRPQSFSGSQNYMPTKFTADADGNLYWLFVPNSPALGRHQESLIVKYDSDGSYDSKIRLHAPQGLILSVSNMSVFANGNYLVTGTLQPQPPRRRKRIKPGAKIHFSHHIVYPKGLRPFTGIFDDQGDLIATMRLPHDISIPKEYKIHFQPGRADSWSQSQIPTMMIDNTLIARGPADTAYLMRPANPPILYTISDAGQLLHEVRVTAFTASHLQPNQMNAMGQSRLLVQYFHSSYNMNTHVNHSTTKYAVINVLTGKVIADFLSTKGFGMAECAYGDNLESLGETRSGQVEINVFSLGH